MRIIQRSRSLPHNRRCRFMLVIRIMTRSSSDTPQGIVLMSHTCLTSSFCGVRLFASFKCKCRCRQRPTNPGRRFDMPTADHVLQRLRTSASLLYACLLEVPGHWKRMCTRFGQRYPWGFRSTFGAHDAHEADNRMERYTVPLARRR